jgi:N6-adenosine-specific RNA methylase IME4
VGDLPNNISKNQSSRWQRVAAVPDAVFEGYLVNARDAVKEISTAGLLRCAEKFRQADRERGGTANAPPEGTWEDLGALVERGLTFGTIYADPPWPYSNCATRGAAKNHYPTMSLAEIAALPVARLAAEQAHCHLWTTNAFLFEAREVLQAWGFEYKGVFLWVKPSIGLGNYWRVAHEFLLLGVRGGCTFLDRTQRSWQVFEPGRHSAKPEEVRQIIMRTSPGPYLELFARRQVSGWSVWGDEVEAAAVAPAEKSGREVDDGRAHL